MKLTKALLAATLLFGLGACSSTSQSTESEKEVVDEVDQEELDKETGSEEAEEIDAETTEGDKYEGVTGDTLSYDNISITLESVSASTPESVAEGYELVSCELTIVNDTGENLDFDFESFSMENNESETSSPVGYEIDAHQDLIYGVTEIAAGATLTGRVTFEEPEGATPLILYYLKDTTTDKEQTLSWTINR